MQRYAKPGMLGQALELLAEQRWKILAGGTDLYPALGAGSFAEDVLDINGLAELRGVSEQRDFWTIGARTTWTDLLQADLPPAFAALKQAAREIGSVQIQNAGTVAGNLCNASPAADGVPALLVLDAEVELSSKGGTRNIPLSAFLIGNRRTALLPGELMTGLRVPKRSAVGDAAFFKLGARRYLIISIAMVAARLLVVDGKVAEAAVAVGSCSEVARRLPGLEADLAGRPLDEMRGIVSASSIDELLPIDDVRATAGYRRRAARELVTRAVALAANMPAFSRSAAA